MHLKFFKISVLALCFSVFNVYCVVILILSILTSLNLVPSKHG